MQLNELFKTKLLSIEEVLTPNQETEAFTVSCITFFSEVKIAININTTIPIYIGYKDTTDELGLGIGDFEIRDMLQLDTNLYEIRIVPLNYEDFDLAVEYQADFMLVSEIIITDLSIKNIPTLESFGIQKTPLEMTTTKEMLRELLSKKYSIATGKTIF